MAIELGSAYGRIILDSSGVKSGVQSANQNLSNFQKSVSTISKGIAGAMGVVTAEVALLKKAFDFAHEGAKVAQMEQSFDTLLDTLGAAPNLLERLQQASRGTIADFQLMSSTTALLTGLQGEMGRSVAEATPQLLEMAKAAAKLNPNLGDTTFLYESLALGIKRSQPEILDNLGIVVKLGEVYDNYAESIGKAADELSAEEKQVALLNAVLDKGRVLIDQAGGSAESATDSYERMNAAIKNSTDELKAWLADGLRPAAEGLTWILTFNDKVDDAYEKHAAEVLKTSKSYEEWLQRTVRALVVAGKMNDTWANMILYNRELAETQEVLANDFYLMTEAEWSALQQGMALTDYVDGPMRRGLSELNKEVETVTESTVELKDEQEKLQQGMQDLQLFVSGPLREEISQFKDQQGELADKIATVKSQIEELEKRKYLTRQQKEELETARGEYADLTAAYEENAKAHEDRMRRIVFNLLTERAALDGLTSDELKLLNAVAVQWGILDKDTAEAVEKMDQAFIDLAEGKGLTDALGQVNKLATEIGKISGVHDVEFRITTSGHAPDTGINYEVVPYASGGSFVVPPGYPNDSYIHPMALTSGEVVTVAPVGAAASGGKGGGDVYHVTNINLTAQYRYESEASLMDDVRLLQAMEA